MSKFKSISQDRFATLFQPLPNHLNCFAPFDFGDGYGSLFETYGSELQFVQSQQRSRIWTLCSSDDGDFIVSGFHFVNRIGYFITEHPVPEGMHVEVQLDEHVPNYLAADIEWFDDGGAYAFAY